MKADFQAPPPKVFRPIIIMIESEEERRLFQKAFLYLIQYHYTDDTVSGKLIKDIKTIQQDFFS